MEFLQNNDEEDDDDDDDDQSFLTAPSHNSSHMGMARVAMETLPLRFCYERREEQSVALAMQAGDIRKCPIRGALETFSPAHSYTGHYTLTLRGTHHTHTHTHTHYTLTLRGTQHTHTHTHDPLTLRGTQHTHTTPYRHTNTTSGTVCIY